MRRSQLGFGLLTILFLALSACAKPQYITPGQSGSTEEKAGDGCSARFKTSSACVAMVWQKIPNETEYGSFVFTIKDATSGLIADLEATAGAPLKVVLVMPGMSHPNPPVVLTKLAPGVYQASEVFFLMAGPWEIHFLAGNDQAIHALIH